ncbi:hypothetical protein OG909_09715 [Streptomyces sp. NBC_01754]|uniref:hypothetical protein n=1 Tax=Streptomyces sp. NBC_01754 TaxID=2975930 RepID=UPI002DD86035|nr:hypothetical protein [Streptomyces sp. NBC_01754]WSC92549.1 hypothetical protein OG909_09715 [Streptomyces sp. NBC_01754]
MREAREKSASECVDSAVQRQLSVHGGDEHYGLLDDSEYGTAPWLRRRGTADVKLTVLPDCPLVGPEPDGEGCCLFADHAEQHTGQDGREESPRTS